MSETAFQTQYRQQFIAGFETHQSLLRDHVTTEAVIKGNEAVFLVADSGGATAVTRGVNGKIQGRPDNNTQNTCTLAEWHDVPEKTGFNIFASQGNQKQIMQMTSMAVMNRKIDELIINELETGTVNTGTAITMTNSLFLRAKTILGNAKVPWDGRVVFLCTPAAEAYLQQMPEFESADYITGKPAVDGGPAWADKPMYYKWRNVNIIVHPELPGVGTNAEKCFMYHPSAVGHAINTEGLQSVVGYDEREDFSWQRITAFMGSKKLQNAGIVVVNHDGSQLVAA